jgi:hypothetical protein
MLIVHGTYSWGRRLVAYRNDYCLRCDAQRLAFQHRTFDVLHVFFVPLVPLGLWKRWHCSVCGNDPHVSGRTRKSLKWAGVAILLLMSVSGWAVSTREKPEDAAFIWGMRILAPAAFAWALWATLKAPPEVKLEERLRAVPPNMDSTCPVCRVMLLPSEPAWQCPQCGMRRGALPATH